MTPYQEPKYKIQGGKIVNRQTGEVIPEDEPIFILRARDVHAASTIMHYGAQCQGALHRDAVNTRAAQFNNWSILHKDRMREPDTQRDDGWTSAGTAPGSKQSETEVKAIENLKRTES